MDLMKRYRQRDEVAHLAADLLDRVFLLDCNKSGEKEKPSEENYLLYQLTCSMVASKYDELDDNVMLIRDLRGYATRVMDAKSTPSFDDIVECERRLMVKLDWNLMILQPIHFLKAFLANGVLFEKEDAHTIA
jgi:hypothetical protein